MSSMPDQEYTEPTNEQLAKFLTVYVRHIPALKGLHVEASILEPLLDRDPAYREAALRHHRQFQQDIIDLSKKMMVGELQCAHIRANGKNCPNANEPGSYYCGLHKDEDE